MSLAAHHAGAQNSAPARSYHFNQPAESLPDALRAYGHTAGQQMIFTAALVAGRRAPAVQGDYTADQALARILMGSGLTASRSSAGVLMIRRADRPLADGSPEAEATAVGEVMVTGSHIRGIPPAAPVQIVTRQDIEQSGYSDVGAVMRSLPTDFAGGQNPTGQNTGTAGSGGTNATNSATVNLHGLGPDATLTLLNGHRLAADGNSQAPDVSGIPLAAVDRIEVVADGASALYGSDAVAGVVNFILRKTYSGADFSATVGGATRGGGFEQDYSALVGQTWRSGYALASVQYFQQEQILAGQRDFTSHPVLDNSLLWPTSHVSVFTSAEQDLTSWASLHFDGLFSTRRASYVAQFTPGGTDYTGRIPVRSYQLDPSLEFKLPAGWEASIDGSVSDSYNNTSFFAPGDDYGYYFDNAVSSIEANANGALLTLPSGPVKLALGGGERRESFDYVTSDLPAADQQHASRTVDYLYGELYVPLVSPNPDRVGLEKLDLSLSGRVEHYSDEGTTANPKVGVRYQPTTDLTFRGTWGTSFKAPTFYQLTQPRNTFLYNASKLGSSSPGYVLLDYGGNPDLKPERARSWTAGVDYTPSPLPSLNITATYFSIDYKSRIVYPIANVGTGLSDPSVAPFVTANATPAQIAAVRAAAVAYYNEVGGVADPSLPTAIIQDLYTNAAAQRISGVDLSIKDRISLPRGELTAFINATWLRLAQQTLPTTPTAVLTGTVFNPPSFRLRTGLTWIYEGFTATGIVNFTSAETDNSQALDQPVSSWTTVDLTLTYRLPARSGPLKGAEASLAVSNLLDAAPPYVAGAAVGTPGIYFDSTNASPIGRFVAMTFRKHF